MSKVEASTIPGAVERPLPQTLKLQLCQWVAEPPAGDPWLHEVKLDGYRLTCWIDHGQVTLRTRNDLDWTARFPPLVKAAQQLPVASAILDGEIVSVQPNGATSFTGLVAALRDGKVGQLAYFVFDLLYLDGFDLRRATCQQRKAALAAVLTGAPPAMHYVDHLEGQGPAFFAECRRHGLEGVVSKRRDSLYVGGRTPGWLKAKFVRESDFIIGGFTPPKGSRTGLGAILVGCYDGTGRFLYLGKVGSGMDGRTLQDLRARLTAIEQPRSPFADLPRSKVDRGTRWVEPRLVARVEFRGWSSENLLWHPAYQGLREDVAPTSVTLELVHRESDQADKTHPVAAGSRHVDESPHMDESLRDSNPSVQEAPSRLGETRPREGPLTLDGLQLTHPERLLYAEAGITKLDLARFYVEIAGWILPHVVDRPLSLVRCPQGAEAKCFFQKNAVAGTPDAVGRVEIPDEGKEGKMVQHLVVRDLAGLVSLVQMSVLEIHPCGARVDQPEKPDRIVFDLDPGPGVAWPSVMDVATRLRDLLQDLGLVSFLKTTGGKGLHVVVPIQRRTSWPEALSFSQEVTQRVVAEEPRLLTAVMSKSARQGKILIDYHRNHRGATAVAAYSTRARPGATVSVPVAWEELSALPGPAEFTVLNLRARLASLARDPWADLTKVKQSLTATVWKRLRA